MDGHVASLCCGKVSGLNGLVRVLHPAAERFDDLAMCQMMLIHGTGLLTVHIEGRIPCADDRR
jgi:hypothetical protein